MMNIINSDPGEVPVGNSVAAILREIVNGYEEKRVFDDWSNEQKDIFLRDIKRNIIERNLSILNPGDSVISAYLAPFGKVGYHAATVVGVNEEEIKVQVISDTLREKKYDNRGGGKHIWSRLWLDN